MKKIELQKAKIHNISISKDKDGGFVVTAEYELQTKEGEAWDRKVVRIDKLTKPQIEKLDQVFKLVGNKIKTMENI